MQLWMLLASSRLQGWLEGAGEAGGGGAGEGKRVYEDFEKARTVEHYQMVFGAIQIGLGRGGAMVRS